MARKNPYAHWNKSPSTSERSTEPNDAANRILDGFFTPQLLHGDLRLTRGDTVFTMGSCFAREIEAALRRRGFTISSMDLGLLEAHDFRDEAGKVSTGFFHRYNVPSMEVEFRRAVGDIAFDEARDLLWEGANGLVHDLNYGPTLPRRDRAGAVARRQVARQLVQRFTQARVIVVTLGLTEAWYHKPSGTYCNGVVGDVLARNRDDFEFRVIGFEENRASLQAVHDCIQRHHATGDFNLVVTVSPVPLSTTFSGEDIVVANSRSKATLRAVAEEFCSANAKAIYFPSYEIAMYSNAAMVWRPDRIHVEPDCVAHITDLFVRRYVVADVAAAADPQAAA